MQGVIYCRVSSKEQVEGTSLEVQEAACRDYARANGISVMRGFIEQGESAKFADRTQLVELIEFCRANKNTVNVLIVWKVDRFARNIADHYSVKATLAKFGVRIVSVTEPIDSRPEGKLMEGILATFSQFDNDIRAMRTVQGMRRKLQEGIFPWGPPFGYKSVVTGDEKKTRPDVPDPRTFPILQRAWKEFATGAYTQADIRRLLRRWGLTTARGRAFSPQTVYQTFTNRYYVGILLDPWSGEEYQGKHVPMVTPEEFARVQAAIAKRNRSLPHEKHRPEFPLRGLVRCEACERYLTASVSRGHGGHYAYYHCLTRDCSRYGKSLAASDVHGEFTAWLETLTVRESILERLGHQIITAIQTRRDERQALESRRRERVEGLNRALDELIRMRAQGLITDEEFLRQKKQVLIQRDAVERRQAILPSIDEVRRQLKEIRAPFARLCETWTSLAPGLRQRFQRLLLPAGFVYGQVGTSEKGLLFVTLSGFAVADSLGVPLTCESWNLILAEIAEFHKVFEISNFGGEPEKQRSRRVPTSSY